MTALSVSSLSVRAGTQPLLQDVDLRVEPGQVHALVGPSGSGKTTLLRTILGVCDLEPGLVGGHIELDGRRADASLVRRAVGWVPQDAAAALDPMRTVAWSLSRAAQTRPPGPENPSAAQVLQTLGLSAGVVELYPHQLSGGMARRVGLAFALLRRSRFLLLDEPTGGLDATASRAMAAVVLKLAAGGVGVLWVTHDISLAQRSAVRLTLLDGGRVVESLQSGDLREARSELGQALCRAADRLRGKLP